MKYYEENRLVKWLKYFERSLNFNIEKNRNLCFVGSNFSYVDLVIFHFLDGNIFLCPEAFKKVNVTSLMKFHEEVKNRPNVKKWQESEQRAKLDAEGPPCF